MSACRRYFCSVAFTCVKSKAMRHDVGHKTHNSKELPRIQSQIDLRESLREGSAARIEGTKTHFR